MPKRLPLKSAILMVMMVYSTYSLRKAKEQGKLHQKTPGDKVMSSDVTIFSVRRFDTGPACARFALLQQGRTDEQMKRREKGAAERGCY